MEIIVYILFHFVSRVSEWKRGPFLVLSMFLLRFYMISSANFESVRHLH